MPATPTTPSEEFFRLISMRLTFRVVRHFSHYGIDCVTGRTIDGRRQTTARIADVIFMAEAA